MISDYIEDGYTEEANIEAVEGVHGELSLTFRPPLPEKVAPIVNASGDDEKYLKLAIDVTAEHLTGWTLKMRNGEVVKISRDNVARIKSRVLLSKVIEAVCFQKNVVASLKN